MRVSSRKPLTGCASSSITPCVAGSSPATQAQQRAFSAAAAADDGNELARRYRQFGVPQHLVLAVLLGQAAHLKAHAAPIHRDSFIGQNDLPRRCTLRKQLSKNECLCKVRHQKKCMKTSCGVALDRRSAEFHRRGVQQIELFRMELGLKDCVIGKSLFESEDRCKKNSE